VESAEDVIAQLSPEWTARLSRPGVGGGGEGGDDAEPFLAGDEAKIFGLVSEDDKQIEQLITESRLSAAEVSGVLMALELKGLIRQYPGKVFARA